MNVDNLALDARNRAIVAAESINEAIDFAIGKLAAPDESSDDDRGYVYEANPPKPAKAYRIARQPIEYAVDQGDADIALAKDILAISPLHAVAA